LTTRGYSVLTANNGNDAINLAKSEHPDLIILDIVIPDVGGAEIAEILKENLGTKNIPIIFLTGLLSKKEEEQLAALEKAKQEKEAHGEIETQHPGYLGAQDTFYVGTLKGIGRIYQQTFIDTYCKVGFAKLYDRKSALTAADLLNDRVLPFYEEHDIPLLRILTDRGTEYCGKHEHHEYELYLAVEDIDHSRTKTKSPQTNGICERFHKTILDEFYGIAFRKKIYNILDELQVVLDTWTKEYNEERVHSGKYCFGKTPMQTFLDSMPLVKEKILNENLQAEEACLSG